MMIFILSFLLWGQVPDLDESFAFGLTFDWRIYDAERALDGPSNWFVEEGVLHQSSRIRGSNEGKDKGSTGTRIMLMEPARSNGTLLMKLSLQEEGAISLLFRARDESHYYRFLLIDNGFYEKTELRLDRRDGSEFVELFRKEVQLPYPAGPWWILGLEMKESTFRISLNDELLLTAEDGAYADGGIGIGCCGNAGLRIDSVRFSEKEINRNLFKPRPVLLKGPVVKNLSPDGFELVWETSLPSPSMVEIIDGSKTETFGDESEKALFHRVKVKGLEPGKPYRYKVISGVVVSPVYGIQLPAETIVDCSFCVYGCSHSDADAHRFVIRSISRKTPNLVFHVGDLVENGAHYEQWFPQFFDPADWIIHSLPYLLCLGDCEGAAKWPKVFTSLMGGDTYYSYSFGPAFFVVLDSNQSLAKGSPQASWLDQTLESTEAAKAKWRFCFIHDPFACEKTAAANDEDSNRERVNLPARLVAAEFDMLFMGRRACYTHEMHDSLHVVNTGGGGAPVDMVVAANLDDDALNGQGPVRDDGFNRKEGDLRNDEVLRDDGILRQRSVWHACKVQIEGDKLEFMAFTPDGKPFDTLHIEK